MAARKLARRSLVTRDAIVAQRDANSVMLDTLSKYGMDGQVALSREGQMVIQIGSEGADPTRFGPEDAAAKLQASFLAVDTGAGCPDTVDLVTIQSDAVMATECIVKDLRASGQFEYVEKDYIFENQFVRRPRPTDPGTTPSGGTVPGDTPAAPATLTEITPNDPLWSLQWNFQNNGTGEGQSPGGAGFQDFWTHQANEGSDQVVVAVVDTGLQMQHPDIKDSPNVAAGWDMVSDPRMGNDGDGRDNDANDPGDMCDPTQPFAADTFHGTHVAGTIGAAASNNGAGVAGGAWNVKIVPVRALGKCGGRLSDINDAIRWAAGLIPGEEATATKSGTTIRRTSSTCRSASSNTARPRCRMRSTR
jgi:serine protease